MQTRYIILLSLILTLILVGCSSGNNPVEPSGHPGPVQLPADIGVMGSYELSLDPGSMVAELTPIRTSSLGEAYIISGAAYFTTFPCTDCLMLSRLGINSDGNLVLGFQIKHPFAEGDVGSPPTGKNRLDLDIFDVALVVEPLDLTPSSFTLLSTDIVDSVILNADGYTAELSGALSSNLVLPFRICYEDENNNLFSMGTDYSPFDVVVSSSSIVSFHLHLTFGYGSSALFTERLTPTYYVPEFNRKAAWKVEVTSPEGIDPPALGNTWDHLDTSTTYDVTIDIYDWNHGATVAGIYPDPANTDHISAASDIASVELEIPGMNTAVVDAVTVDTTTNGWDDPITYTASIANENGLGMGVYVGLVKVTDSRLPGTVTMGGEPDTLMHTSDGIAREWFDMSGYVTYQTFYATVVPGDVESGWADTWRDFADDRGFGVTSDASGNSYVTGFYQITGTINSMFLRKYNPDGVLEWEKNWSGFDGHGGVSVAVDNTGGYIYVCGYFSGTTDFDPDGGGDEHTSNGDIDSVLCKYDLDGNYQYIRYWGGDSNYGDTAYDTVIDSNSNVYVMGSFAGTAVDFDPGSGIDENTATGGADNYVTSFDSSGDYRWSQTWGGTSDEGWYGACDVDTTDAVYVTGYFHGAGVDFDTTAGEYIRSSNGRDVFLQKFDSTGLWQWARVWGGESTFDEGYGVATDSMNNVYVVGRWENTVDFDPDGAGGDKTATGHFDVFLTKHDSSGVFQDVYTWGGTSYEITNDVTVDFNDNVIVAGYFQGADVDFDHTAGEDLRDSSDGQVDIFITKLDSSAGYLWTQIIGGTNRDEGEDVAVDSLGNIFTTGYCRGDVEFAPVNPPCNDATDIHGVGTYATPWLTKHLPNGCW